MITGSLKVRLLLRTSRSLKEKRQVVQSIKDRLKNQFNIAIAEVDALDHRQMIVLGIATVSNDSTQIQSSFQHILNALRSHPVAEFVDHEQEIF